MKYWLYILGSRTPQRYSHNCGGCYLSPSSGTAAIEDSHSPSFADRSTVLLSVGYFVGKKLQSKITWVCVRRAISVLIQCFEIQPESCSVPTVGQIEKASAMGTWTIRVPPAAASRNLRNSHDNTGNHAGHRDSTVCPVVDASTSLRAPSTIPCVQ